MSRGHRVSLFSFIIQELSGIRRVREPVRFGAPFPRGILFRGDQLVITDQTGKTLPHQITPLAHWPDDSIQWGLLEFITQVEPYSKEQYHVDVLETHTLKGEKKDAFLIDDKDKVLTISTGNATFEITRDIFKPFRTVFIGDKSLLSDEGTEFALIDAKGRMWTPIPNSFKWVANGPIRTSLRIDGSFRSDCEESFALFTAILDFWVGSSFCAITFQVHNPKAALHPEGIWDLGDPGSIYFNDLSLIVPSRNELCSLDVHTDTDDDSFKLEDLSVVLYQDSSGGDNWNSPNHVRCSGESSVSFQGYRLWSGNLNNRNLLKEGKRANPYFKVNTTEGWICGTVRNFWQNFPKALSVNSNILRISLFPHESSGLFELQGGEKKTHTILLNFGMHFDNNSVPQFLSPLSVSVDPEWIEKTGVVPHFVRESEEPNGTYLKYIKNAIDGPHSFFKKREIIDEYGWRNFGDVYADHEAVHHKGAYPFISHYNNQYDVLCGMGIHYLRSGDRLWYALMEQYAKHVIDIDIYHTDQDKPAYNHGLFWHTDHYKEAGRSTHRTYSKYGIEKAYRNVSGGGPGNEHNYISGLLLYYYLTGDLFARESIIELAQWVLNMDDGSKSIWCLFDEGPTGLASQTVTTDYHGPGRGSGNSINCMLDAYKLTDSRYYLSKAEELIKRCIHPDDEITKLNLDDPEHRWSYLVFLQVLGKYLDLKNELAEQDWYFFYTRDSFLHYAEWILNHEVPYKDVLDKVEIPTETWPAQDVRKAYVLNHASEYAPLEMRESYKAKARFFFDRCLEDVLSFKTAYLTRPIVILMVFGYVQAYFDLNRHRPIYYLKHSYQFGTPKGFIPQRMRIRNSVRNKMHSLTLILRHMMKSKLYGLKTSLLDREKRGKESL